MTKNLVNAGRIFLAIMFLFSGVSKLISLAFFDGMVAELFLGPEYYDQPSKLVYTQWLSRILISAELVLGVAILQNKWVKKFTVSGIMLMLLIFTVHLFYEGLTSDKGFIEGNCGCFGDVLPMNNLESIIKNIVAMLVGVYVWLKYKTEHSMAAWVGPFMLGLITLLTLSFGIKKYEKVPEVNKVEVQDTTNQVHVDSLWFDESEVGGDYAELDSEKGKEVEIEDKVEDKNSENSQTQVQTQPQLDYTTGNLVELGKFSDGKRLDVSSGNHLVCMFSMTCGHCQESYKEMCEISQYASLPTIHLVNFGKEFEQQYFFNQAGGCTHRYYRTEDYTMFNRLLEGKGFPRIIAYKDGKIVNEWDIDSYNKESFMKFYGIEEKKKEESGGLQLQKKDDLDDEFSDDPWK
jgi:uncharacterized membrane protein YphA (DoxX/SURF4 family)